MMNRRILLDEVAMSVPGPEVTAPSSCMDEASRLTRRVARLERLVGDVRRPEVTAPSSCMDEASRLTRRVARLERLVGDVRRILERGEDPPTRREAMALNALDDVSIPEMS